MINKLLSLFGCLLWTEYCLADPVSPSVQVLKDEVTVEEPDPNDYVDLHSIPLFREAYYNWCKAETQGEGMDALSIIWELTLQTGTYLDVSQKLAASISDPDESATHHWAVPDIISIMLVANQPEKVKPWIKSLRDYDERLLVPLYPLFALFPNLEVEGVDETAWQKYQLQAYIERGVVHVKDFQKLMAERDKYTHDQMVVLMVQNDLLR